MTLPALQASDAREDRGCAGVSSLEPDLALPEERRLAKKRLPGSGPRAVWTASPSAQSCGKVRERARACMPGAFGPGVAPRRPALPALSQESQLVLRVSLQPGQATPEYLLRLPSPRARHHQGSGRARADLSFSLRSSDFSSSLRVPQTPGLFLRGAFQSSKALPTWKTPRFPQGNFSFQVEVTFLGPSSWRNSAQGRPWFLCTEQRESVCGLPPRDSTVSCVDTRPCSGALCGLSLLICEPDLPIRGRGGCCERENVSSGECT